ncbi:MAG: DnaD domain protein [Acholeplasmataceae bacterium]
MKNASTFQVHRNTDLSRADDKVLALLYQPLLGLEAYALYRTFGHLADLGRTMTHQELFDFYALKQQPFLRTRNRLEALNLLVVYRKDDHFRYVLKSPLSAKQFLVDTVLGSYLQSEIGQTNTDMLAELFRIEEFDSSDYRNVTKTFDELYEFKHVNPLSIDHSLEGKSPNGGSSLRYRFDYEGFVKNVPERLKNSQLLSEKFKEQITKIAFVYQFSVTDMVEVYEQAVRTRGQTVTLDQLNLKARLHYQNRNKEMVIEEKEMSETDVLAKLNPQVIIQKYSRPDHQGVALSTALELLAKNDVDPGIINVILILVLKNKNGVLPHYNYLIKVLNDWLSKGVQTTEDAIAYSTKLETKWQGKTKHKKQRVAEPDWMDDYLKDLAEMEG